jgi:hypothetical protein
MSVRVLLWLVVAANAAWGLFALFVPNAAGRVVGLVPDGTAGVGELRAVYGGLVLALAVALAVALRIPSGAGWLHVFAILYGGLVAGRVVSLALDGLNGYTLAALALEGFTCGLLLWGSVSSTGAGR